MPSSASPSTTNCILHIHSRDRLSVGLFFVHRPCPSLACIIHETARFGGWRGNMAFGKRVVLQVLKMGICNCPVNLLPLFYARFARRIVSYTAFYDYSTPDRNGSGCDDGFVCVRAGIAACAGLSRLYPYSARSGGTPHQRTEGVRGSSGGRFPLSYSCHR